MKQYFTAVYNNNPLLMTEVPTGAERYFINWVNSQLRPTGQTISNVGTDFQDGIKLVALLEVLSGQKCPVKMMPPKNEIFKLQNLSAATDMAKKLVKNLMVNGRNFLQGTPTDVKLILGFIFDLVLHCQVNDINVDGLHGKDGLLMWCQKTTKSHQHVKITNFSSSWTDGMAFLALADAYNGCGNYKLEATNYQNNVEQNKQRLSKAFILIKQNLGVDEIIDAEFATSPDDKACITYVSLIFKAFQNVNKRNKAHDVVQRTIQRAKVNEQMVSDLIAKMNAWDKLSETALKKPAEILKDLNQSNVIDKLNSALDTFRKQKHELQQQYLSIENAAGELNQYRIVNAMEEYQITFDKFQEVLKQVEASQKEALTKLRKMQFDSAKSKQAEQKTQWRALWDQFCKEDQTKTNINQDELTQLLMANSQELDDYIGVALYHDGKKVNFQDFCEVMDALENNVDSRYHAALAFAQVGKGQFVIESDLKAINIPEADINWMKSYIQKPKQNQFLTKPKEVNMEVSQHFFEHLVEGTGAKTDNGEEKIDFGKLIEKIYE